MKQTFTFYQLMKGS